MILVNLIKGGVLKLTRYIDTVPQTQYTHTHIYIYIYIYDLSGPD